MAAASETGTPQVSIIIPARNEEVSLPLCLESLAGQSGTSFEIIVVDDGSTDHTADVALGFPGVKRLAAAPLPTGWSGKCGAIMTGVNIARGEWLLLTDADTVHLPGSLAAAVREANQRKVDLLSYSPAQKIHGFWQSAIMPVIYAELATHYRPKDVSDPNSPRAAANGQYILVKRETYLMLGGHARVAATLLEDVALATNFKRARRPIFFRYGGDRVRTRMYRTFAEMRDGWTRNLTLLFPATLELAMLRLTEFFLIACSGLVLILEASRGNFGRAVAAGGVGILFAGLFWSRIRKAHFPLLCEIAAPIGLPAFAWLLWRSRRAHQQGQVSWKGRVYGGEQNGPAPLVQIAPAGTVQQRTLK
jgi:glycosyltransferase involved in cell wall biosynthesis